MTTSELFAPGFTETPYWWEAVPPAPPAPVDLPARVDVAIVGGGYCGLSAALELRRHGASVAVLEAEPIGLGASSKNGGMVSGSLKLTEAELARAFGSERAAALVADGARAMPCLEELLAREGIACHYRRTGRFVGAHCPGAYQGLAARVGPLRALTGMDTHLVPRERQRDLTPWLRRRLIPLGSYMIATEPLPPDTARRLVPRGRMLVDTRRVLSYFRLSPDGTRVLFGGRASFRRVSAREAAPRLHGFMTAVWPELSRTRITHAWTGSVAFTFDHVPHMGVHDGVHFALGCQGSGVAMATYLGRQTGLKLAGKATRRCAFDGLPFPTRPGYRGNPWFLPFVGSAYRVRDWLERRAAGG